MEKSGQEYITVSGACLASGVTLCSYIVYRCIFITHGARVDQQVHYYGASSSAWMEQANFLSGFVKIHLFAVKFFGFSSVTHSAVYLSFETLSVNC